MSVVTNMPLQQAYYVPDVASLLTTYNRIRWYRGRNGSSGAFEAATAAAVAPATLLGSAETPHQLNGKSLKLKINGVTVVTVNFTDPDPVSSVQAAAAVALATVLLTAVDEGGYLRITTVATGSGASIEVLESEAAPYLGFGIGQSAVGLNADGALSSPVHEYTFTDQNSSPDFFYKVGFLHNSTGALSSLSIALPATRPDSVPLSETVGCYIRLANFNGAPLCGRTIAIHNVAMPNDVTSGGKHWGVFKNHTEIKTDGSGYATTRILRGAVVDISVVGSGFTRRITIPDTGDTVDMLDPALVLEDEFGIKKFDVDFAIRTS